MNTQGVSRATWLALAIALLHLGLAWIMRTPGLGWIEDDAAYLLLSQQLQHFQYREVQDILAPIHARFPPAFPAMLAVVGKIFGGRLDAMLAFVALCSAASVLVLFDAARRTISDEIALLATALYAINPLALADAGSLMSEAPFKLFIVLALWGVVRENEGTRFAVVAGAATILSALTRSAGVVFIPVLGLYWLWKRRYTWVAGLAVGSLAVAAWFAFSFNAPDAEDRRLYVADLKGSQVTVRGAVARRVFDLTPRLREYLGNLIPWTLAVPTVAGTPIDNGIWVVSFIVLGIAGAFVLLRNWILAAMFLGSYGALIVLWRYAFDRLVRPIVPLLLVLLLAGASQLAGMIALRYRRWAVYAVAALLALGATRVTAAELSGRLKCDRAAPADSPTCWTRPEREFLSISAWIRDSTPSDALFFVSKERAFFVHANRKSINQDRGLREDSASLAPYLRSRGVSYTVVSPVGVKARHHARLVKSTCRDFELVKRVSGRTFLLRLLPEPAASDSTPACNALREFGEVRENEQ